MLLTRLGRSLRGHHSGTWAAALSTVAKPKVVVVSGPTAIGKSDLALHLAKKYNGEIISVDTAQVLLLSSLNHRPHRSRLTKRHSSTSIST